MAATIEQRFKSGEFCGETGTYDFDGYADGSSGPLPSPDDMCVILGAGDEFPLIGRPSRACYWKLSDVTRDDESLPGAKGAGL
jgi:hypothetical protein